MAYQPNINTQQEQKKKYMETVAELRGIKLGIRVYPVHNNSATLAMVNLNIGNMFVIDTIRIVQGKQGQWFISFPQVKKTDGTYKDIAFPVMMEARTLVEDTACELLAKHYNGEQQ